MEELRAIYSGPTNSGMCTCGHAWDAHHLMMVARQEYVDATGEYYVPCECEFYGCNESGGLDQDGLVHCMGYVDRGLQ